MARFFRMPSLGADMEAGTLAEWLKRPGDTVSRGDVIAVVETQKGAIEVEIFDEGVIEKLLIEPGQTVPVGAPLAELAGEEGAAPSEPEAPAATEPGPAPVPVAAVAPAAESAPAAGRPRASPAARRLAAERGVDLAALAGSGPDGAVLSTDLPAAAPAPPRAEPSRRAGLDLAEMRKAIAAAMSRAKREIPHFYLSHEIDLSAATEWLARENAQRAPEARLLLGALYLKALALALRKYPEFNGFYVDDGFRPSEAIHVGMAVAIRGGGLVAPAIHDTDRLGLDEIMARLRDLADRVRRGGLRSSEMSDPTVTLSSLGERGVEALYGVIYPPQVALVGLGRVGDRARVLDGALAARPMLTATLSADHRASDGHRGALLLNAFDGFLQQPEAL